jgi:hypothetical protein
LDLGAVVKRTATLGLSEDEWRKHVRPDLQEVGYFDTTYFDPGEFKPLQPNCAFANTTKRDGYWGAKIVAAFRDDHIDAIVARGGYREEGAAEHIALVLKANRDKIARHYFDRVVPLDFFHPSGGSLEFDDLGVKYRVYPGTSTRYRVRCAMVDQNRSPKKGWSAWEPLTHTSLSLGGGGVTATLSQADDSYRFLAMEFQLNRGAGWSGSVTAYLAPASGRIVAVDR